MSKYCPHCGNILNDAASFCGNCGANVSNVFPVQQNNGYSVPDYQYPGVEQTQQYYQPEQEFETEQNSKKNNKLPVIILSAVLAVLIAVLIIFILSGTSKNSLIVKVPDVVDRKYSDAAEKINKAELHGIITDKVENGKITKNFVAEQSPEGNKTTLRGGRVELVLSAGKNKNYIPSMEDYSFDYANSILVNSGFKVEREEKENKDYAPDTVCEQSVREGLYEEGETVKLYVTPKESGMGTADVKVPDLKGKTIYAAKAELETLGLYFAVNGSEYSDKADMNTVLSQSAEAGSSVKKGSTVFVKISLGKQPSFVPDAVYRTEDKAEKLIEDAGLKYTAEHEENREVAKGTVISQSVEDGTAVDKNTEVIITVSDGFEVEVPLVVGLNEKDAVESLIYSELAANVIYESNDSVPKDTVIAQDVEAGQKIQIGSVVTITVSGDSDSGENAVDIEEEKDGGGKNDNVETEKTEKQEKQPKQEKQIKIKYASPVRCTSDIDFTNSIVSVDGTSYYIINETLVANSKSGQTVLCSEKCSDFIIVDDVIYYTTVDNIKDTSHVEFQGSLENYATSSVRKMNLDGSDKELLFSFSGVGSPIFADAENVYYANNDVFMAIDDSASYSFHRYSLKDKKNYPIVADMKYDGFTYVNGNIFFCKHSYVVDYSSFEAYKYEIKSQKLVPLSHNAKYIFALDDDTVLLFENAFVSADKITTVVHRYNVTDGSYKKISFDTLTRPVSSLNGKMLLQTAEYVNNKSVVKYYTIDKNLTSTEITDSFFKGDSINRIVITDGGFLYLQHEGYSDNSKKNIGYFNLATGKSKVIYSYTENAYLLEMNRDYALLYRPVNSNTDIEQFIVKLPDF